MKVVLDQSLVDDAAAGKAGALGAIGAACYPVLCRLTVALQGDTPAAMRQLRLLIERSFDAAPHWADAGDPFRWYLHHLILDLRRLPDAVPRDDPLLKFSSDRSTEYAAFIRAIRHLARQQREAFLLAHGESFTHRDIAVAMDCSTTAVATHLSAAEAALRTVAADSFDPLLVKLQATYASLSPDAQQVREYWAGRSRQYVAGRRARVGFKSVVWGVVIAAIAYGLWRAWQYMST